MSIKYGQFCPVSRAAEVLGERWTILIIRELLSGASRFNDIQRGLSQISPALLTKRLTQLQDCGLVIKKTLPKQRRTEYYLSLAGRELEPIVLGMAEWGMRWARGQMTDDELDVQLLMSDLNRRLDRTKLPGGRTVIRFVFTGLPKFAHWWIVLGGEENELCVEHPGSEADVTLQSDLRTMTEIWAGDLMIAVARKAGRLSAQGDPDLVRTLSQWLRPGMYAHVRPHPEALRF